MKKKHTTKRGGLWIKEPRSILRRVPGKKRRVRVLTHVWRKRKWRKITPAEKENKVRGTFCKLQNREKFYEQVIEDRQHFRKKLGEEQSSAFQLWFQIGDGQKRRKKADKRLQYTHGLRKFVDMKKARMFLGLDGVLTSGDKPLPRWRKSGKESVCTFEKRAWLVQSRSTSGRARKPKILREYLIQE